MSLVAPFFLLGLLAIGLPLWLHRLQTQNPERLQISSSMLLEQSERRLFVQKRLRFLLLLALRIALLALLALAFAQPLWRLLTGANPFRGAQQHLIVIDTSLSMNATDRLAQATAAADSIIGELGGGDRAQLVSAGTAMELVAAGGSGMTSDKGALRRALTQIRGGSGRLEYAQVMGAADTLAGDSTLPLVIDLVSDFQNTGLTPRFADLLPRSERGRPVTLALHPLPAPATANWSVTGIQAGAAGIDVTVRAHAAPESTLAVRLRVNDTDRGELRQRVPANGEARFRFAGIPLNNGDNRVTATLSGNDSLKADDSYYSVLQGGGAQSIPLLTADTRGPAVTYQSAALAVSGGRYVTAPVRVDNFDTRTLERYRFVLIDDLGAVDNNLAAALRSYLESGGAVFAAVGARAAALSQLPITGQKITGSTARNADPLTVGRIEASHPVLANAGSWQNLSVARMLKLAPAADAQVLITTDDGQPLLLEQRIGAGRLLLLTTSLDNSWSDLPVQPVFVSFMTGAARWLAGEQDFGSRQTAGAILQLPQTGQGGQVIDPEGRELLGLSATRNAAGVRLTQAGFYQVVTPARESLVAVNVDERESDLTPMGEEMLANWRKGAAAVQQLASAGPSEQSQGSTVALASWLLMLLVLVVVLESLAGNWLLGRSTKVLS